MRKQLSGALESTLQLKQEREKLEDKAARHSQRVVELQAALDENSGLTAALQEKIQHLESQLELKYEKKKGIFCNVYVIVVALRYLGPMSMMLRF